MPLPAAIDAPPPAPAAAAPAEPARAEPDQARVFRRLRARTARNGLRVMLEAGRVRLVTMVGTSLLVGVFVFLLSLYAFAKMFQFNVPVKGLIVGGLFDLMFFTLGVMLVVSTGIILYASLFTAPEARFLLATPAKADRVFAVKFQGAVAFSSWAFLILGLPILVSYGLVAGVPWYFYPLLPATLLGFVLLPGSVSALGCLLFVRYVPRTRRGLLLLGAVAAALAVAWFVQTGRAARSFIANANRRSELDGLVAQFTATQSRFAPSHWMTSAVMAAARDDVAEAVKFTALIWSNGLLLYVGAAYAARRVYRNGFDRVNGAGRDRRVYHGNVLDAGMEALVFYLDRPTRLLVVKDFRTFRRDPTQWVLLVLFGGLLVLGGMNFRQYYRADLAVIDRYIVSLANVAGTSVLLCAGLSRFIFPLVSLEGRKFWILGLMPVRREQILMGKFAFAATGSVLIALAMIGVSDLLLGLPAEALGVHLLTGLAVAVGLSGLNVGLGAYMPNFRETDPSKIVVGFSGTVNMVVGLGFLMIVVALMSGPLYLSELFRKLQGRELGAPAPAWVYVGLPVGVALATLAAVLPMRAGARALRETEF